MKKQALDFSLFVFLISSVAQAAPVDLIVRFHEPQNTASAAAFTTAKTGIFWNTQVEVLNHEEGVIKLRFNSLEEARVARERLAKSDGVVNIAPNLLYRSALSYQFHDLEQQPNEQVETLAAPLVPLVNIRGPGLMGTIPGVQLPPVNGRIGPDPLAAKDWALPAIGFDRNAAKIPGNNRLTAAVIDTGVDYNHEDLIAGMWRRPGNNYEVGYDFAHNNAKPYDLVHFDIEGCMKDFGCRLGLNTDKFLVNPGHGTHCAGHVGAVANNALGIRGVGAGVRVMGLKFFYDVGEANAGQGDDAAAIKSIDYAIKNGAKIISASWGGRSKREEAERSELKQALVRAQRAGVLVVIAAGNDGIDQDDVEDPSYPAAYDLDNLIIVAASDKNDSLAKFSNYGSKSVHIAAPGVKILSTTVGSKYSDEVARFKGEDGKLKVLDWDGTSMATPIVAGAAALIWSKYPNAGYREIRDRILKSARRVSALNGKVTTGGVLNIAAALR